MKERDKMKLTIISKEDKSSDLKFWLDKTPEERISAVEFLRSQYYALNGYNSLPRFIPSLQIRKVHK
jgi:hypothetical protein